LTKTAGIALIAIANLSFISWACSNFTE